MFDDLLLKRGYLILIGGAEEKQGDKQILTKTIQTVKPNNVVVIPTASSYPRDVFNNYFDAMRSLGVETVECFDIRYPEDADKPEFLEKIEQAQLVFFSGGDQVKLVETLINSKLLEVIRYRFERGLLSIAGTSAGAAAASDPMLFDGDYKGFLKGQVNHGKGFGFLPDITVDTHFLHRERIPRLVQCLSNGLSTRAIGLDEDTGIVISPDSKFEVVGSGMVTILNSDKVTYNDIHDIEPNEPLNINNLRIGFLSNGATFSLKKWSVLKPREPKKKAEQNDAIESFIISPGAYI